MRRFALTATVLVTSTLILPFAASAEGKADRARKAIAEATGKVDAATKVAPNGDVPRLQAQAQAALRQAREDFAAGHKEDAVADAIRASQLADTAIGVSQRNQATAASADRADAQAVVAGAQQDAAAANARAEAAQQAAAAAADDAARARAAPPVVIAAPAPPTTTITTETVKTAAPAAPSTRRPVKHVVHRRAARSPHTAVERTTTTVTTRP